MMPLVQRLITVVATGLLIATGLSGCNSGSSDGRAASSNAEARVYVNRVNEICEATTERIAAAAQELGAKTSTQPDEDLVFVNTTFAPALRDQIGEIEALATPATLQPRMNEYVAAVDTALAQVEADPSKLYSAGTAIFEPADTLAKQIGITQCSSDPA